MLRSAMNKHHSHVDLCFCLPFYVLELHFNVLDKTRAMNLNCGLLLKMCVSVRNALADSERQLTNGGFTETIFHTLRKDLDTGNCRCWLNASVSGLASSRRFWHFPSSHQWLKQLQVWSWRHLAWGRRRLDRYTHQNISCRVLPI